LLFPEKEGSKKAEVFPGVDFEDGIKIPWLFLNLKTDFKKSGFPCGDFPKNKGSKKTEVFPRATFESGIFSRSIFDPFCQNDTVRMTVSF